VGEGVKNEGFQWLLTQGCSTAPPVIYVPQTDAVAVLKEDNNNNL